MGGSIEEIGIVPCPPPPPAPCLPVLSPCTHSAGHGEGLGLWKQNTFAKFGKPHCLELGFKLQVATSHSLRGRKAQGPAGTAQWVDRGLPWCLHSTASPEAAAQAMATLSRSAGHCVFHTDALNEFLH